MAPRLDLRALAHLHLLDVDRELHDQALAVVEGEVPSGLHGTLFRNGPGRFTRGTTRFAHPFDGDGYVVATRFADQAVHVRSRFVQPRALIAEQAAGRVLYRGFGTPRPGGLAANALRLGFRNSANTNVLSHAGRLWALWEGGAPHQLDPATLATLGEDTLDGLLAPRGALRALGVAPTFSAHPRVDPATGELWNFGLRWGLRQALGIYARDAAGQTRVVSEHALPELSFIHDMALTERYVVVAAPAVRFDVARMLFGASTPVESLRARDGEPLALWLVPRDGRPATVVSGPPGFAFHIAGAYDRADGSVVCDLALMSAVPDLIDLDRTFGPSADGRSLAHLTRMIIDPTTRTMRSTVLADDVALEMPVTAVPATHHHRHVWATAVPSGRPQPYHSSLARLDTLTGTIVRRDFYPALPSEPVLVPRPGARSESDAWLLAFLHHPGTAAALLVLDAATLETEARAMFPIALPPGLHGSWVSQVGS